MPSLLIYIPTYNRCQSLRLCVERILAEINGLESEVVIHVSDNHSPDETPQYLESIQHSCLQWSRNDSNIGGALNVIKVHGLSHLADFTFMLGDDDFVLKGSIRRLVSAIRGNPDIDFFFLNTLSYAANRLAEVINKLSDSGWSDPPAGGTLKSSHPTDTRCLLSDLFSPGVDEVLGGAMMCFSFRSKLVSDHIAQLIKPADQGHDGQLLPDVQLLPAHTELDLFADTANTLGFFGTAVHHQFLAWWQRVGEARLSPGRGRGFRFRAVRADETGLCEPFAV
jgi:hypothetical protein